MEITASNGVPPMHALLSVKVYCLSGTGNSLRVARRLDAEAHARGIESSVIAVESADPDRELVPSPRQLVALVFPTHGFTAPWKMIRFALGLPPGNGAAAFAMATRGALKIGRVVIPGAAGTAALLIGLILRCKDYRLRGVTGLDMPSNWMSLYSGFSLNNAPPYIARWESRAGRIFGRILEGRTHWATLSNAWDVLLWGLPLLWLSLLYLLVGRFFLAKLFFANNDCIGCGSCADNCPNNAIAMKGRKNPRPYWRYNCESCMRCMGYCPTLAVEAGQSWLVLLYFITSVPAGTWFLSWLTERFPGTAGLDGWFTVNLLNLLYLYASLFLSYALFHRLLRIWQVNALFTYTTFTRLYPRYHEPGTRLKDLERHREQP
jgi:NAD-dependent dihydropyrimidine dehydrogenase PreA subunit